MVRKGKNGSLHLLQVKHFLETGKYLSSVNMNERNGIRKFSKKFTIEGNLALTKFNLDTENLGICTEPRSNVRLWVQYLLVS